MRTTLTLEPDVSSQLERLRAGRGETLKELVNSALRIGLAQLENPPEDPRPSYVTPSDSLGGCRIPSIDDVAEALALGEGEAFR